jgi:DNA invertase Pin-like site-specific DNA recombinase
MKVALYARVSTEDQNPLSQMAQLEEYAKRNQYEIYKEYTDIISGTKDSRPQFNQLLTDMRQNKFSAICVTKLDRLGRSLRHLLGLIDEFNAAGIGMIATTQNIDTKSSAGKLQLQIMGAFAEFERNLISERTREALKGNLRVGKRGRDKKERKKRGVQKVRIIYPQFKEN